MKILIRAVGRIREPWLRDGIQEYRKRLARYCQVEIEEVQDAPDSRPAAQRLDEEAARLLTRTRANEYVILLDLDGERLDSLRFADRLPQWMEKGGAQITFILGGSHGVSPAVRARANERISLSELTFTHAMARLILLEQIYRAYRIGAGDPYHK